MRRMLSRTWSATVWVAVVRVDPHDRHAEPRDRAVDDLLEDGALVLEVEIEGPPRDAGGGDDVVDLCRVVAAPRKDVAGHVEDLLPSLRLAHGAR